MLNTSPSPLYARLACMSTCIFPSGSHCECNGARLLETPDGMTGCQIFKEIVKTSFVMLQYLTRSVRMVPTFHESGDR